MALRDIAKSRSADGKPIGTRARQAFANDGEPAARSMRPWAIFGAFLLLNIGCTSTVLERSTVSQSMSTSSMRYRQVLQCLAVVAHDPGAAPSFSILTSGGTTLSDTLSFDSTTVIDQAVKGFSKETLMLGAKRNPDLSWTINPVAAEPLQDGLRYACLWALYGPLDKPPAMNLLRGEDEDEVKHAMGLLRAPQHGEIEGYHLGIKSQLCRLPAPEEWIHVGSRHDVPKDACFSAHCGDTYVWVSQEGMAYLSEFTLVIMDIATIQPESLALRPILVSVETRDDTPDAKDCADPPKAGKGPKPMVSSVTESLPAEQSIAYDPAGHPVPGTIKIDFPTSWRGDQPKVSFESVERRVQTPIPKAFRDFSKSAIGP